MTKPPEETLQTELLRVVRGIRRRVELMAANFSRNADNADAIAYDLTRVEKILESSDCATQSNGWPIRIKGIIAGIKPVLDEMARYGVVSLVIDTDFDGTATVQVDGGMPFTLPPKLGALLSVLATDNGSSTDHLVGWKSLDDVARVMSRKMGKKIRKKSISNLVWRLRKELYVRGKVNPSLVQRSRLRGLRFALRNKAMPEIKKNPM